MVIKLWQQSIANKKMAMRGDKLQYSGWTQTTKSQTLRNMEEGKNDKVGKRQGKRKITKRRHSSVRIDHRTISSCRQYQSSIVSIKYRQVLYSFFSKISVFIFCLFFNTIPLRTNQHAFYWRPEHRERSVVSIMCWKSNGDRMRITVCSLKPEKKFSETILEKSGNNWINCQSRS